MPESIVAQSKALKPMTVAEHRAKWLEVFSEDTQLRGRAAMWRQLASQLPKGLLGSPSAADRATARRNRPEFRQTPPGPWFPGANHLGRRYLPMRHIEDLPLPPLQALRFPAPTGAQTPSPRASAMAPSTRGPLLQTDQGGRR
jgi:hypothetical protein